MNRGTVCLGRGRAQLNDFEIDRYLPPGAAPSGDAPEASVVAYIRAFAAWARDCDRWTRENRARIDQLGRAGAREALRAIRATYCAPKNRQYQRDHKGYFFFGGTYDALEDVLEIERENARASRVHVGRRGGGRFRFTVVRAGGAWRLEGLERLDGAGRWVPDLL